MTTQMNISQLDTTQFQTGEEIYNYVQQHTKNKSDVIEILSKLTPSQKSDYKKHQTKLRQKKFYETHKEKVQERNRNAFKIYVQKNPERWKELNLKHQNDYQNKKKGIVLCQNKAKDILLGQFGRIYVIKI